jgi:mRNA interferase RelE/StbE
MIYSIEIDKDALKYLQKLERPLRIRITNALQVLLETPFHSELDIKRLKLIWKFTPTCVCHSEE